MGDSKFWLGVWITIVSGVVLVSGIIGYTSHKSDKLMADNGYVQKRVPTEYTTIWVKEEQK